MSGSYRLLPHLDARIVAGLRLGVIGTPSANLVVRIISQGRNSRELPGKDCASRHSVRGCQFTTVSLERTAGDREPQSYASRLPAPRCFAAIQRVEDPW